jgi:hypothetical protein
MKRILLIVVTAAVLMLFASPHAFAICQSCPGNGSLNAMCYTLTVCERGATLGACVLKDRVGADGQVAYRYCDGEGSTQDANCNGNDISCANNSPSNGGDSGSGNSGCTISAGDVCPASCSTCKKNDIDMMIDW